MPPTKGGTRPPKGGKGSGKGKKAPGSAKGAPNKSGSVKKGGKAGGEGSGPKKAKKRTEAQKWSMYVHKTLHTVHPKLTISSRSMKIMGSLVEDLFDRIRSEASQIAKMNKTKTLTAREVQTTARLMLPGDLSKHAMGEGTKAVAKYNNHQLSLKQVDGQYMQ
jgi:histone H2B